MYFFLVLGLLGSSIVYGFFIFSISVLIAACQPISNIPNALETDTYSENPFPPIPLHSPEQTIMPKSDLAMSPMVTYAPVGVGASALKSVNLNSLERTNLESNLLHALITNPMQSVSPEWQILQQRYYALPLHRQQQIAAFYNKKSYMPVWITDKGTLNHNAKQAQEALNQEIYLTTPLSGDFLAKIPNTMNNKKLSIDSVLQKDLEFTLNMLPALEKIRNGITTSKIGMPTQTGISDNGYKPFDFTQSLLNFSSGQSKTEILNLTQFHEQYLLLKNHVKILNDLANKGGYITVPSERILKFGMRDNAIILIRKRLMQSGFVTQNPDSSDYDNDLEKQVMAFQSSRGIKADGVIGYDVYKALNHSIQKDLKTILVNIERIRHTPDSVFNAKHVNVNVPEMVLYVTKGNQDILSMKTIIGRKKRKTPIFNDFIEYVDFNPYWNVPYSLATKDILPKLKVNPSYITAQNIKVFQGTHVVNPYNIHWNTYSENNFPFTLRQEPSKNNALGTVKFMFPNVHAVYLHDTPAKGIFYQDVRSESSGCIRVSKPKELAVSLLENTVSETRINQIFALNVNKALYIKEPVPISIEYLTAFVRNGVLNIRPDIYEYDTPLVNQLIASVKK
jgi:L,D-transpeptidase YcbB